MTQELIEQEVAKVERCLMVEGEHVNVLPNSNHVSLDDWDAPTPSITLETKE